MMLFIALPCSLELIAIPFSSQSIPIFSCPLVVFVAKIHNAHPLGAQTKPHSHALGESDPPTQPTAHAR